MCDGNERQFTKSIIKQKKERKDESTDSLQKNTNSTTSYRTGACRDRHIRIPASARNTAVRFHQRKLVIPRHYDGRLLPVWLNRLDV
jgi:hypothetical protein